MGSFKCKDGEIMNTDTSDLAKQVANITEGWSPIWVILLVVFAIIAWQTAPIIREWRAGTNQKLLNQNQHTEAIKRLNIEENRLNNSIQGSQEGPSDDA